MKKNFTIITVCLNVESIIERTILSVLGQTFTDYEYIFIDGKSSDKTLSIIEKYIPQFEEKGVCVKTVSEPDTGIYNAMNKGIGFASGEYINFMNAGDEFASENILAVVNDSIKSNSAHDIIYGDVLLATQRNTVEQSNPIEYIKIGMPFCHQSTFTRRELLLKYSFDECYRICADYKFFLTCYLNNHSFFYINIPISIFAENKKQLKNTVKLAGELADIKNECGVRKFSYSQKKKYQRASAYKYLIAKFFPRFMVNALIKRRKKAREKRGYGF